MIFFFSAKDMGKEEGRDKSVLHKAVLPFLMAGFNVLTIDLRNHGMYLVNYILA